MVGTAGGRPVRRSGPSGEAATLATRSGLDAVKP